MSGEGSGAVSGRRYRCGSGGGAVLGAGPPALLADDVILARSQCPEQCSVENHRCGPCTLYL